MKALEVVVDSNYSEPTIANGVLHTPTAVLENAPVENDELIIKNGVINRVVDGKTVASTTIPNEIFA